MIEYKKVVVDKPREDNPVLMVCPCCKAALAVSGGKLVKGRSRAQYKRDHQRMRRKA